MQKKTSGRSLAVRVGALTAAVTLMLAGGVAMASSASAANDKNPDKGNSSNAPGQQSADGSGGATTNNPNGGANHGDNGGTNTPGGNQNGKNDGGTGHLAIDVCHATRSASNPYVFITVDFSSVDEAWQYLTKGTGNGHGDHVGEIWDGQRSGVNWGDIISSISGTFADGTPFSYPGYNLGATSKALGGLTGAQILANGCQGGTTPVPATLCVIADGSTATFPDGVDSQAYKDAVAQTGVYSTTFPCGGGNKPECINGVNGTFGGDAKLCQEPATFTSGIKLCEVVDGKYNGITSVPGVGGSQKAADEDATKAAFAKSTGDNIIPPAEFTSGAAPFPGYNWNEKTQARFDDGSCSEVLSVVSAIPLPATVAPASGNPKPAKVPASATLPGSVPAGDGSQVPALPLWALAMVVVGAIGAAAAGSQILGNRK